MTSIVCRGITSSYYSPGTASIRNIHQSTRRWMIARVVVASFCIMGVWVGASVDFVWSRRTLSSPQEYSISKFHPARGRRAERKHSQKKNPACADFWRRNEITKRKHSTNSNTSYAWIGNMWIPPPGIPRYAPDDMRDLLQGENLLWTGDSTARQGYATMYTLMNATNAADITPDELNTGINVNKKHITENCTLRSKDFDMLSMCRQVPSRKENSIGRNSKKNATQSAEQHTSVTATTLGAFDMSHNPRPNCCFSSIPDFINSSYPILSHQHYYSVLVFSLGVWETVQSEECPNSGMNALLSTLDYLKDFSDSNHVRIIWQTHGGGYYETKSQRQFTRDIHDRTRQWFHSHQPQNMALVEFGTQVRPRTYGSKRIYGDSVNHFGPEARTLALQMITHALYGLICDGSSAEDDTN